MRPAVLARTRPRWHHGHHLGRYHGGAPASQRRAAQDRPVPADRHAPSPSARRGRPARRAAAHHRRSVRCPIEADRTVNAVGTVGLAGRQHPIGYQYAGRRLTVRLDNGLLQLVDDGVLLRSLPNPLTPTEQARIRDARPAGPPPQPAPEPVRVERRVSCRGSLTVARQRSTSASPTPAPPSPSRPPTTPSGSITATNCSPRSRIPPPNRSPGSRSVSPSLVDTPPRRPRDAPVRSQRTKPGGDTRCGTRRTSTPRSPPSEPLTRTASDSAPAITAISSDRPSPNPR
jgi:hypothetical protein